MIEKLSSLHEVQGLYVFGREVDGETDEYSDIDLVCCSADPAKTQQTYRRLLNGISRIRGTYLLREEPDVLVEMLLFQDYSPYQKLDFSIVSDLVEQEQVGPFRTVYESDAHPPGPPSKMSVSGRKLPLQNSLNDMLFSIPRFTKCLFRRDFDMYRRWTGMIASMHVLLYEKHFGWENVPRPRLNPFEYKSLYKALHEAERQCLEDIQPLHGRPDIVLGFQKSVVLLISLYREKASHFDVQLDNAFIDTIKQFMEAEIERFLSQRQP